MTKMYRVYSIIERPKQESFWLNIGVAFPHEGGPEAGLNVLLQALPLGNGKLVLRPYDPEQHDKEEADKQATVKKEPRAKA